MRFAPYVAPGFPPVPPLPAGLFEALAKIDWSKVSRALACEADHLERALDLACERIDELEDALRRYAPHVCNDLDVVA